MWSLGEAEAAEDLDEKLGELRNMSARNVRMLLMALLVLSTTLAPGASSPAVTEHSITSNDLYDIAAVQQGVFTGGSVETIRIVEYPSMMAALNALSDGQADLFGHAINRTDYSVLNAYPDLTFQWAYDTKACVLTMNADQYPLGDNHLRRAIAHALDKSEIAESAMNNTVSVADFLLPLSSCYQIETSQGGEYYHSDVPAARYELGLAGMLDVDEDGIVEGPDGSEIVFTIRYPFDIPGMNETAALISGALLSVGLNNTPIPMGFDALQVGLENHWLAYDIALYEMTFPEYDPTWGITTFASSLRTVAGQNVANVADDVIDNAAFACTDNLYLDAVLGIVEDGLHALMDVCPVVPLFFYQWLSVYSDERHTGWLNETNGGAFSIWNAVSIEAREGETNDLVVAVLPTFFDDFFTSLNPFASGRIIDLAWLSKTQFNPYMLLYDSPVADAPNGAAVVRASTSWDTLYAGMASDLIAQQSRSQFWCDSNAAWTDGEPLNAQDFKFSFELYRNYTLVQESNEILYVKVIGDYVAGITLNNTHLFSYRLYGAMPIVPRHVWQDKNVATWEPPVNETVGSGPYMIAAYVPGSSLEMAINTAYYPQLDTQAPELEGLTMYPEVPSPIESVVVRAIVRDRSRIDNVTLHWTYVVGGLNFTDSDLMELTALGYEATIPARVTASKVYYNVTASDIWGNAATVLTGVYYAETTTAQGSEAWPFYVLLGSLGIAVIAVLYALRRH